MSSEIHRETLACRNRSNQRDDRHVLHL